MSVDVLCTGQASAQNINKRGSLPGDEQQKHIAKCHEFMSLHTLRVEFVSSFPGKDDGPEVIKQ